MNKHFHLRIYDINSRAHEIRFVFDLVTFKHDNSRIVGWDGWVWGLNTLFEVRIR